MSWLYESDGLAGVWVLPRRNAFGYPNAMLAKLDTTWKKGVDGRTSSTLLSIAGGKYYKRDFRFSLSFFHNAFSKLIPFRDCTDDFYSKTAIGPYVEFLLSTLATF